MPVGFRIASAWVDIDADTTGLKEKTETAVKRALAGVKGKVQLKVDTTGFKAAAEAAVKKATANLKAKVQLAVDSKGLRAEVNRALKDATSANKAKVAIGIASTGLRAEVQRALKTATTGKKPTVQLGIDAAGLHDEIQRALTVATIGQHATVRINTALDGDALQHALNSITTPTIRPNVDSAYTRTRLMAAIRGLDLNTDVHINPDIDAALFRAKIAAEVNALKGRFTVPVTPDINTTAFAAKLQTAARAVSGSVNLDLNPRVNELVARAQLAAQMKRVGLGINTTVRIDPDLNTLSLTTQVAAAQARLNAMPHDLNFRARVDVDAAQVSRAFVILNRQADAATTNLSRRTKMWSQIIMAGIGGVAPAIGTLVNALQAVGPALAVAVPMAAELGLVFGAIAVGGNGVVNAIEASTKGAKQFDEAMGHLTPTAQKFVQAIITSKGAFHDLQQSVQNMLFDGLDTSFRRMATDTIPDLRIGLGGMANDLNGMAKGTMSSITNLSRMGLLKDMFGGLQLAFKPLIPMPGQFLSMLTKTTIAASPLLIKMTTSFGNGVDSLNAKIDNLFATGRLQGNITRAGDAFTNFFKKIGNNAEWKEFIRQVGDTGPGLADTLGKLAVAILKVANNSGPTFALIMKLANGFANLVNSIPSSMLSTILGIGAAFKIASVGMALFSKVVGVSALAGLRNFVRAAQFAGVSSAISGVIASVGKLKLAMIGLGALAAVGVIIAAIATSSHKAAPDIDALTKSFKRFADTGKATGEAARVFGSDLSGLTDAIRVMTHPSTGQAIDKWIGDKIGFDNKKIKLSKDTLKGLDDTLTALVQSGNTEEAAAGLTRIEKAAKAQNLSIKDVTAGIPHYRQALKDAKQDLADSIKSMGLFGQQATDTSRKLDQLKNDTKGLNDALFAMNDANRNAEQAVSDYKQDIADLDAMAKKRSVNLSFENDQLSANTQAQRDAGSSLRKLATDTEAAGLAQYQANGNWTQAQGIFKTGRAALISNAEAMGLNKDQAVAFANSILNIPSEKQFRLSIADQATGQLKTVTEAFRNAPDSKTIKVDALDGPAIAALKSLGLTVKQMPDGSFTVTAKTAGAKDALKDIDNYKVTDKDVQVALVHAKYDGDIKKAQDHLDALKQKRAVAVGADKKKLDGEVTAAQKKVDALRQKRAIDLKAINKVGPAVAAAQSAIAKLSDKSININAIFSTSGSATGMAAWSKFQNAKGGIIHGYAEGGLPMTGGVLNGPGTKTSDSIMGRLSKGEFVMRAAAVDKYGPSFMKAINAGQFPKFASGGSVATAGMRSPVGASAAPGVSATPTSGTFTVTDATGKPVASAMANFKLLQDGVVQTYTQMATATGTFGQSLNAGLTTIGLNSQRSWQTWATGMNASTLATYNGIKTQTDSFGSQTLARTNQTSSSTQASWSNWRNGMQNSTKAAYTNIQGQTGTFGTQLKSTLGNTNTATNTTWNSWKSGLTTKTASTYNNIKSATSSFGTQTQSKFKSIVSNTGSAWGGLSPKFKPPVSYLVHTVINKGIVGSMNAITSKLGGGKNVGGISVSGFAEGGHIKGAGSPTSDSIPARLSNGEFVMQAKAVNKFGVGFMSMVNNGKMPHDGGGYSGFSMGGGVNISMPAFATGGVVGVPSSDTLNKVLGDGGDAGAKRMTDFIMKTYVLPLIDSGSGGSAMKDVQRAGVQHIQANVEKFVKENFGGAGSAAAGLRWARTQYGKPYQWGGNGNPSWDCSGFMSAIESVIRGEKPHRRWATGSFSGATAPSGWKLNANAPFKIGVTNAGVGHTAGTIGKENVESSGGIGVHGGSSARGWNNPLFGSHYGYVGPNATKKARGGYISGPGSGTSDSIPAYLSDGEFVVRSAAVKRFGTGFLNSVNQGMVPGFSKGGVARFVTGGLVAPGSVQSPEGLAALNGLVTVSGLTDKAIALGHRIDNETMTALRAQDSLGDLLSGLQNTKNAIMAAFTGPAETGVMAKFDSTSTKLISLQDNLDKTSASLTTAQASLDDLKGKFDSLKTSVSDNIVQYGSITKVGTYGTSTQTLITQMQSDVAKSSEFSKDLAALKSKGLSGDMISQIAAAGVSGGGLATATSLMNSTPAQIKQLNDLQTQLKSVADAAGDTTAKAMYGAGVDAAQGLVDGLQSKQGDIEDQMRVIAQSLIDLIQTKLGIASPSKVMRKMGQFTGAGFELGVVDSQDGVERAVQKMVALPGAGGLTVAHRATQSPTATVAPAGETHYHFAPVVTVNGADLNSKNDRRAVAASLVDEMKEAIRQSDRKRR